MPTGLQPEKILGELGKLWTELAHPEKGPATASGVLRACAMTLIVATNDAADAEAASEGLAQLMHEHPSRAIVLRPADGGELSARVFAQCWMPFGSRQQICCEQIEITASLAKLGDVPGLMLGLVAPDLPVVLWCRGPRWFAAPHFNELLALTRKVIIDSATCDSPRSAFDLIERLGSHDRIVADLAWARITGWREIISHSFATPADVEAAAVIREVHVQYAGPSAPPEALYLGAWLKRGMPHANLSLDRVDGPPGIRGVSLDDLVYQAGEGSTIEVRSPKGSHAAMLPPTTECAAMREELSIIRPDPIYERVRGAARELAA